MNFFIYFVLTVGAFLFAIFVIVLIAKRKLNQTIGTKNLNEIVNVMKNIKELELEEYSRPKNVSGMTKVLEPSIIRDFPDFWF